jgi:hypothetical protein
MAPTAARGLGGALKLPQQVRAEPGRQTFLVILWSEQADDVRAQGHVQGEPQRYKHRTLRNTVLAVDD